MQEKASYGYARCNFQIFEQFPLTIQSGKLFLIRGKRKANTIYGRSRKSDTRFKLPNTFLIG
jgi:hypothetical protein